MAKFICIAFYKYSIIFLNKLNIVETFNIPNTDRKLKISTKTTISYMSNSTVRD